MQLSYDSLGETAEHFFLEISLTMYESLLQAVSHTYNVEYWYSMRTVPRGTPVGDVVCGFLTMCSILQLHLTKWWKIFLEPLLIIQLLEKMSTFIEPKLLLLYTQALHEVSP